MQPNFEPTKNYLNYLFEKPAFKCGFFCYNIIDTMKTIISLLVLVFVIIAFVLVSTYTYLQRNIETNTGDDIITATMKTFDITSSAFKDGAVIPSKYTCDGENINPPLSLKNIPQGTKSFVLIVCDPDVPAEIRTDRNWDHWIVFNIPPEKTEIEENDPIEKGVAGITSSGKLSYEGPCPPKNFEPAKHRYFFKAYALKSVLNITEGTSKVDIEAEMSRQVLDSAELVGVYERN